MKTEIPYITAFLFFCFTVATFNSLAQGGTAIPFTLEDRERIIRIEERLDAQQKAMDARFDAQQKTIDARFEAIDERFEAMNDKLDKLYTLIYFILGGVFGLIGLIFWDRRSYIKPVKEDIATLLKIIKEYSVKQPELAEILRANKLL